MKLDYYISRLMKFDFEALNTLCFALGPYRNLSTLTGSILFLHPDVQVLNHGGERIFPLKKIDFLSDYSEKRFRRFVKYMVYISAGGKTGDYGGSITLSHAFDHEIVKDAYRKRFGSSTVKKTIRSVFWKEPLRTVNFIRNHGVELEEIFEMNKKLKFLMPVRNPLDTAISNTGRPHHKIFAGLEENTVENVLDRVLFEISWFLDLQKRFPDRFFYFLENEFDERMLDRIAEFLSISSDERWKRDSLRCYRLKPHYEYSASYINHYKKLLEKNLSGHPEMREKMEAFSST